MDENKGNQTSTITLVGQSFVPASDFSEAKGMDEEKIIRMVRDGFYDGRFHEGRWYVSAAELNTQQKVVVEDYTLEVVTFDRFIAGKVSFSTSFCYFSFICLAFIALQLKAWDSGVGTLIFLTHLLFAIVTSIATWRSANLHIKDGFWVACAKGLVVLLATGSVVWDYTLMMGLY